MRQVSPESEHIYDLIIKLYKDCQGDWKSLQQKTGISHDELDHFLHYATQFLANGGNYKGFGDSKFVPRISRQDLKLLCSNDKVTLIMFEQVKEAIYADADVAKMHLGYPEGGHVSTYYPDSPTISKEEITIVSDFLDGRGLLPENTRLKKLEDGNFELLLASSETSPTRLDIKEAELKLEGKLAGKTVKLKFGDHSKEMKAVANAMRQAQKYAGNENEQKMTGEYASSFETGSQEAFKDAQRYWIKDKGPVIECNIGFVETYRDPHGIRGEWEGFVAMVNKERTKAFGALVNAAPELIPKLPWSKEFEKDKFLAPDFTSLEVLTFAGSGIPAGINIPNHNDIRQNEGFKNVSLGNVLNSRGANEKIPFIKDSDLPVYEKLREAAFEVQVGLHELLGHGCGKLLQETEPGVFNFDHENPPISPITKKAITTWYKPGQTWGSVFSSIGSSYEECRAECVAMSLCCDFPTLKIYGFGDGSEDINGAAGDVLYAAYLSMARAGVAALEFWDPKSRKWGQIHMQARFAILQTFLSAGPEFCRLDYSDESDLSDLTIFLDRSKILSHGRPVVNTLLQKLGVYKSTADIEAGTKMYEEATHVNEFWAEKIRPEVLRKKQPRKVFVQSNTVIADDGEVKLVEYESTCEGMIKSFAEREYI